MPKKDTFQLPLSTLRRAVSVACEAVDPRNTVPALTAVRIEAQPGAVEFAGTDHAFYIRARMPVEGVQKGAAALVPGGKLARYLAAVDAPSVSLSRTSERILSIQAGTAKARLGLVSGHEFPHLPAMPAETRILLPPGALERMLRYVHDTWKSALKVRQKGAAAGALLEVADGRAALVVTDGARLARYSVPSAEEPASAILPDPMLPALLRCEPASTAKVAITEERVFIAADGRGARVELAHRLAAGTFPAYHAILQQQPAFRLRVNAGALAGAVRRCIAIADREGAFVLVTAQPDGLKVTAAQEHTGDAEELISAASSAPFAPVEVLFQGPYLLDALDLLVGDIELGFVRVGGGQGIVITHELPSGEAFEYALMAVRHQKR